MEKCCRPASQDNNSRAHDQMERMVFDTAPDGILVVDAFGNILRANTTMLAITGYSRSELLGRPLDVLLPPEVRCQHGSDVARYFHKPRRRAMGAVGRVPMLKRDGSVVPVDIALSSSDAGDSSSVVAFVRDLSSVVQLESKIEYQATHDDLTGLFNRYAFHAHIQRALAQAQRYRRKLALLLLDLDDFKVINDSYGHLAGDQVLVQVSRRLQAALRSSDMLARHGGDEFVVLLSETDSVDDVVAVAQKLLGALNSPCTFDGFEVLPCASIGIACYPGDATDAVTLMRFADLAMYGAKKRGRNAFAFYDVAMGLQAQEHLQIRDRLKDALQAPDALQLAYQPQVDLSSGAMVGVEALLRWRDPVLGAVAPDRFIPVAEATGLMHALGDWVLETACRQLAQWWREGIELTMSINVSMLQLRRSDFSAFLQSILVAHQIDPRRVELEITETVAMAEPQRTREVLLQLTALGISVALDDFGNGYSALSYLRELPVSRIKIDRTFMQGVPAEGAQVQLVRAILSLAKALNLKVVAEGIETNHQLQFLIEHRCDCYQGWLFAKALGSDAIRELWHSGQPIAA